MAVTALVVSPVAAEITINLEGRPAASTVNADVAAGIGLYAVCDPGESQLLRAAEAIFTWNPVFLHLMGLSQVGAVPLMSLVFPANDQYGLNGSVIPPGDDPLFTNQGSPVNVTDAGSLLTTFHFTPLAKTSGTIVDITDDNGRPQPVFFHLYMTIYGRPDAGIVATSPQGSATVQIIPAPMISSLLILATSVAAPRGGRI